MPAVTERPLEQDLVDTREGMTAKRVFDVEAASAPDARNILSNVRGIRRGVLFRNALGEAPDQQTRCVSIDIAAKSVTPIGGLGLWSVTANYRRLDGTESQPVPGGPPVYKWGRAEQTEEIEKDLNDKAIVNSKGQPYTPFPQRLQQGRTLTIQWYVSVVNMPNLIKFDGVTNSVAFIVQSYSVVARQMFCRGVDPFEEQEETTDSPALIRLQGNFEFKPRGELYRPLKLTDYELRDGKRVLLDGAGGDLGAGADVVFNSFDTVPEEDFNELGI